MITIKYTQSSEKKVFILLIVLGSVVILRSCILNFTLDGCSEVRPQQRGSRFPQRHGNIPLAGRRCGEAVRMRAALRGLQFRHGKPRQRTTRDARGIRYDTIVHALSFTQHHKLCDTRGHGSGG